LGILGWGLNFFRKQPHATYKLSGIGVGLVVLIFDSRVPCDRQQAHRSAPKQLTPPEKAPYQPTAAEQAILDKHEARKTTESPAPRVLVVNLAEGKVAVDHLVYDVACKLLGTTSADFTSGIIRQLFDASDKLDEDRFNFLLAVIKDAKPSDQLEAMLFAQMAVVHLSFMKFGRHFDKFENTIQQDSAVGAIAKLGRTFAAHLEAAKRYRTGGEQKITVQRVTVHEGGQAIVGDVNRSETVPAARSTLALTDARQAAMPIIGDQKHARVPLRRQQKDDRPALRGQDAFGQALHVSGGEWERTLPDARRRARIGGSARQQERPEAMALYARGH
jgi:hypothetical protein